MEAHPGRLAALVLVFFFIGSSSACMTVEDAYRDAPAVLEVLSAGAPGGLHEGSATAPVQPPGGPPR